MIQMKDLNAIPVIFPGHGGMIGGEYVTAPAKMHEFEDGVTIYEGEVNRSICKYTTLFLKDEGMPSIYIDTELDTSLNNKTLIAERYESQFGNCFLLDVHCNAGGGTGSEIYTSPGQTGSDPIATSIIDYVADSIGTDWSIRKGLRDGDPDKEEEFYVLMNTYLRSVLLECGFMDTREDAEFLLSKQGQKMIAKGIANGILKYNGFKKIPKNRSNPKCE